MASSQEDWTKYDNQEKDIIKMLDKIEFSSLKHSTHEPDFFNSINTLRLRNARNNIFEYSVDSLPQALSVSYEKKCAKLKNFIDQNKNLLDLRNNLSQLYGFARSAYGLIKDEYRELIWPVLAENIPSISKAKLMQSLIHKRRQSNESKSAIHLEKNDNNENNEFDRNFDSDSDFESAVSTFSNEYFEINGDRNEDAVNVSIENLKLHKDWHQVELDVNRTLSRFPPNISENERNTLQKDLIPLIVQVLWENISFSYYQGFHDVCLTLLLVMNFSKALYTARFLTKRGSFHNYLTMSLEASAMTELNILYVLLYMHDGEVERYLRDAELGTIFALSWLLTWFSHDLKNYSQIVLFFDFFLSSHPLMPVYVSAALISERRKDILSCEQEMPSLYKLLNILPDNLNVNRILDTARSLFERYPPYLLQGELQREYKKICERHRRNKKTIKYLQKQTDALRMKPRVSRYQALAKPCIVLGTAAAFFIWMSKNYF